MSSISVLVVDDHDLFRRGLMEVLEEEYEWRRSAADSSPARIKWGYDPTNEYRMRNEMALRQVSWENSKPATIMSINF